LNPSAAHLLSSRLSLYFFSSFHRLQPPLAPLFTFFNLHFTVWVLLWALVRDPTKMVQERKWGKLIREATREMGTWKARNKFAGIFRESKLHFTVWYMVFVGISVYGFCWKSQIWFLFLLVYPYMLFVRNLISGFCWYIRIWFLLKTRPALPPHNSHRTDSPFFVRFASAIFTSCWGAG
jgi:hypothetical protein